MVLTSQRDMPVGCFPHFLLCNVTVLHGKTVGDGQRTGKVWSVKARLFRRDERTACKLLKFVLTDTNSSNSVDTQ